MSEAQLEAMDPIDYMVLEWDDEQPGAVAGLVGLLNSFRMMRLPPLLR